MAAVQRTCRSPVLDSYFAMTANLGTHTFFMAALPICFWCGYPGVGIALVHMLASDIQQLERAIERVRDEPNVDHTQSVIVLRRLLDRPRS